MIKLTLFNYDISISFLFKVFFIICLILITIFLIYQEKLIYTPVMINRTKYISSKASYFSNFFDLQENFEEKENNILEELKIINEFKQKKEGGSVSSEETSLINREDLINSYLDFTQSQYTDSTHIINDKFKSILDVDKSSVFGFYNIEEFLKTLTPEEMLAFSGLLLNQLILGHVISIILILYGDYLIKRFNLENRLPKLAKFIQLRRKLQSYYLKLSFT